MLNSIVYSLIVIIVEVKMTYILYDKQMETLMEYSSIFAHCTQSLPNYCSLRINVHEGGCSPQLKLIYFITRYSSLATMYVILINVELYYNITMYY